MIIQALMQNTTHCEGLCCEHGLSIWLETNGKRILFDSGSSEGFAQNARQMGISLQEADLAILSHGHYDHSGGMLRFLEENDHAPVYLQQRAPEPHYSHRASGEIAYIGIDPQILQRYADRLRYNSHILTLSDGMLLFSRPEGHEFLSTANRNLLIEKPDGEKICDDFAHEQSLLLSEGDKLFLFCGCAHAGIVNIVEQARDLTGRWPDYVVGGFHLSNPSSHRMEAPEMINGVAGRLLETGAVYYTCHCTGQEVYQIMRERKGDRVRYLAAGDRVVL